MTPRACAIAWLALAGCAATPPPPGDSDARGTGAAIGGSAVDPETPMRAIFAALGRIDLALRKQDASLLAPVIADDYTAVACGIAGRFASSLDAARARIAQPGVVAAAWTVEISADATMAWAIANADDSVAVEVLERRGPRWMIVAGAASGAKPVGDGCTLPPTEPAIAPSPTALHDLPLHALSPATASLVLCGLYASDSPVMTTESTRSNGTSRTVKQQRANTIAPPEALAIDRDRDGVPDLLDAREDRAHVSPDGTLAWVVGGPRDDSPGYRSLAVAHRGIRGWDLDAVLWTAVDRASCPPPERGRVVVTDTSIEILDNIFFRKNEGTVDPRSIPVLDAIAATLLGNPSITRVAIETYASLDETDPIGLAERRGLDIRQFMNKKGIPLDHLDVHFFGVGMYTPPKVGDSPEIAAHAADPAYQRVAKFEIENRE